MEEMVKINLENMETANQELMALQVTHFVNRVVTLSGTEILVFILPRP